MLLDSTTVITTLFVVSADAPEKLKAKKSESAIAISNAIQMRSRLPRRRVFASKLFTMVPPQSAVVQMT